MHLFQKRHCGQPLGVLAKLSELASMLGAARRELETQAARDAKLQERRQLLEESPSGRGAVFISPTGTAGSAGSSRGSAGRGAKVFF